MPIILHFEKDTYAQKIFSLRSVARNFDKRMQPSGGEGEYEQCPRVRRRGDLRCADGTGGNENADSAGAERVRFACTENDRRRAHRDNCRAYRRHTLRDPASDGNASSGNCHADASAALTDALCAEH